MTKTKEIIVLLPTYEEADNLKTLIPLIHKELTKQKHLILVVNDASGDGTEALIKKMSKKYPVALHERKKKDGLGKATIAGFQEALKKNPSRIIVMDADHSHPPSALTNILKKSKDYDVVIGSRYMKGGGVDNWVWYRRLLSKAANFYARTILGLKAKDITGSYRAYNPAALKKIDLNKIKSNGYTFQEEILYALKQKGATISETPIIFHERREGQSKMPKTEILTGAFQIIRIRLGL
ncbi:polyprenol monophosphomannose synthase [Candidatus Woesearchaeota archaeon]|nr:polyprenol monophosphomannose synthase [Candidatus Woesearchaeota archaeon]